MAKPELGTKRLCLSCGAKFYDLNRDPATCPKCGAAVQANTLMSRVAPPVVARAAPAAAPEEEEADVETGAEMVSLEDVEAAEEAKEPVGDDDLDIGEEVGGDEDTFLEEEEEGEDDVADLIDGDIEDDEEG